MISNLTIRNRDSHGFIFLNFLLRVKELLNSDRRFGFCMKNCIYSQLEMSRILDFDSKIRIVQTLVSKNAISYRMSPSYADYGIICENLVSNICQQLLANFFPSTEFPGLFPFPGNVQKTIISANVLENPPTLEPA